MPSPPTAGTPSATALDPPAHELAPTASSAASSAEPAPPAGAYACLDLAKFGETGRGTAVEKRQIADALLEDQSVEIYFDPNATGVVVPAYLHEPHVVLQIGRHMALPIPDLRIDDVGFSGTLSFRRTPFEVHVPWSAVFAIIGVDVRRGRFWKGDVPAAAACR